MLGTVTPANKSPPVSCAPIVFRLAVAPKSTVVSFGVVNGFSIGGSFSKDKGACSNIKLEHLLLAPLLNMD